MGGAFGPRSGMKQWEMKTEWIERRWLCADTDRLCGWGFSIGNGDRGAHILSGKFGQRDRYAVVAIVQDRIALELMPYGQASVRVETEQRDRRQRFLSCLDHRGRIEKGASGVRFIGKRYGDLSLSRNRRIHFVLFLAAKGKCPSTSMVVIQLFIGYASNGFIREMLRCSCSGTNVSLFFQWSYIFAAGDILFFYR